jgi:hypothetical protein
MKKAELAMKLLLSLDESELSTTAQRLKLIEVHQQLLRMEGRREEEQEQEQKQELMLHYLKLECGQEEHHRRRHPTLVAWAGQQVLQMEQRRRRRERERER